MFILMDKPIAASWFELGTILEIQPAYGFDLALPPPQIVNPLSLPSSLLSPQASAACIFISWETHDTSYPSYPPCIFFFHPSLVLYKSLMSGADKIINDS